MDYIPAPFERTLLMILSEDDCAPIDVETIIKRLPEYGWTGDLALLPEIIERTLQHLASQGFTTDE